MRSEHTQRLTREMAMLLDLAISRYRAEGHADEEIKEQIHGALEAAKQEITHLQELVEDGRTRSRPKMQDAVTENHREEIVD